MQTVILAAGQGKRLQPLTNEIPKAMVKINGKPMLQIIIEQLKSVHVDEVVVIVHYMKEKIQSYFGDGSQWGINIHYIEQKEMKGTGDALLHAEPYITEDRFLCIACDSLFETNLLKNMLAHKTPGVITAKEVENPQRFGILETQGDKVTRIIEKPEYPPTNLANFSVYLFPHAIFDKLKQIHPSSRGEYEVTDAIQLLIDDNYDFGYEVADSIVDIGTIEQLNHAESLFYNSNI